ncbi:hypothetical protein E2C01_003417 [Portunus trituberculatus]|uniref:Uncharacterized protein n=1 Tax=Portunus trituberculatus TaxID=210409 RepID=A0A5B7CMA8_PORTR|nr:hypothetical protein [Portunus trituberculatus]
MTGYACFRFVVSRVSRMSLKKMKSCFDPQQWNGELMKTDETRAGWHGASKFLHLAIKFCRHVKTYAHPAFSLRPTMFIQGIISLRTGSQYSTTIIPANILDESWNTTSCPASIKALLASTSPRHCLSCIFLDHDFFPVASLLMDRNLFIDHHFRKS